MYITVNAMIGSTYYAAQKEFSIQNAFKSVYTQSFKNGNNKKSIINMIFTCIYFTG